MTRLQRVAADVVMAVLCAWSDGWALVLAFLYGETD